jgi:ATP-dependent helicase YprA (DUF1998 family)
MTAQVEFGVTQVAHQIYLRLHRYLAAQYHIRDTDLIEERRLALEEPGCISQRPFVEVTPSYAVVSGFSDLKAPPAVTGLLQELVSWKSGIGVFPPYKHQAEALEHFFSRGRDGHDLIVATGTGSGKTETFLYAILGALALEGTEGRHSFLQPGIRALLLYPMNALVSDQTARLRRLLGNERLAGLFRERWGRHPRFGMYTSRTPYPGVRTGTKDKRHLDELVSYFERLETSASADDQALVDELRQRGRWPAKDIVRFFARALEEKVIVKTGKHAGKEQTRHHWGERFLTQAGDRELLTRHEMQALAPDLIITNYSMLEYMLLRPIERPLFSATRSWLAADHRNQLLLILDEAHMYRGVGGAEVGLLIRRLMSRLGVDRARLRCILTSASLGSTPAAKTAGKEFARGLTGQSAGKTFAVVTGTAEQRRGAQVGTAAEAAALASVSASILAAARVAPLEAQEVLDQVCRALGWVTPPQLSVNDLAARQHICRSMEGFGPLELLIETCAGKATKFSELAVQLFPSVGRADAERATDGLLALGTFARRTEPGREEQPLLPTRVHLLFRGLPPLYVCVNSECSKRRHKPSVSALAGRLFTEPRTHCDCGGRVYELLTHRDCGAAYIRVFGTGPGTEFFWHERGGNLTEFGKPLHELQLLLDEPHPKARGTVTPVVIDVMSGRTVPRIAAPVKETRICYRASDPAEFDPNLTTFKRCPICLRVTNHGSTPSERRRTLKIMDLATKGEQPFANLVREQFVTQLPTKAASDAHPNEGRKTLLFSDGRQKAARLARDLPREIEQDSFREALVLAVDALSRRTSTKEVILDERLYAAFVSVCARFRLHFFDRKDQQTLLEHCDAFRIDYGADLELAFDSDWTPHPPPRYRLALLRQIGDPYYSLIAACAAVVEARRNKLSLLQRRIGTAIPGDTLEDLANAWLREMIGRSAFDPALSLESRTAEFAYFTAIQASDGLKRFFASLGERTGLDPSNQATLRDALFSVFTEGSQAKEDSGRLVTPGSVTLRLALDEPWLQCAACGHVQLKAVLGGCGNCADERLEQRPPNHPYMVARKGFFREPLRAVLRGERPIHITAEEHTAQLSQRDVGVVYATTEKFELRFQDVPLAKNEPPVDILSCTTTMEVGIDIGSLTAVGLRTVPPQRENYQQRAGRAGRRGTSVSSVLTFAQGGAHDAHYFANPAAMISGPPREPRIKSDNRRLARRHIHSHLLQTFFHGQIDELSVEEQEHLTTTRPDVMSAFGDAREFFTNSGPFSHAHFDSWVQTTVLAPTSKIVAEIASWLPPELARSSDSLEDRKKLVREVADRLRRDLQTIKAEVLAVARTETTDMAQAPDETNNDDTSGSLLEILFDKALLPSYAFPTDLCSFVIQEWAEYGRVRVAERPQLAKTQALSEYAPGRLLIVNKGTYRVGGIFIDGPPTASPAAPLFTHPLQHYVGCRRCSFVRMENDALAATRLEGTPCPVCGYALLVCEFLDPPAFSPERGRVVSAGDREQEITYASSAQLPELAKPDEFVWDHGPGTNLRHAYGQDVLLVVANKGKDSTGFAVCESCGGAWLDGEEPSGAHPRPFLLPAHVRARENAPGQCSGTVRRGLFLGHEFRTDILLLRTLFRRPFDFSPKQPWLYDALATLAEALALGASLHLDIDPGDLSAGFRLLPPITDELGGAEIYLFDTASGGAGYAADAGGELEQVLDKTKFVLAGCKCERSCTKCLRHYGNRLLHPRLDRHLAVMLLEYVRSGQTPAIGTAAQQAATLAPLGRFLTLEGWTVASDPDAERPLVARSTAGRNVVVGIHPALLSADAARASHPMSVSNSELAVLLPDYVAERDLPSAYQVVCGLRSVPSPQRR